MFSFVEQCFSIFRSNGLIVDSVAGDKLQPPERIDSLPSRSPRDPRMTVQVLTHNGSMSEASE